MLGFDGEYLAVHPKANFFSVKNHKKSVLKHSIEKPILLNPFIHNVVKWPNIL